MSTSRARRRRRWLVLIGLGIVLVCGTGFTVLRVSFEGPALGSKISTLLNKRMRGRVEIGAVEWDTNELKKVLTGGWVPVRMRDVKVWDDCALNSGASALDEIRTGDPNEDCTLDDRPDPDPTSKRRPRKLLLRTDLITGEIDVHALLFGNHDFVFRNLWVYGGEALLEQTAEPYPLHAYDRTIVSIVTAFYPRMHAGFRAGIYADSPPPVFDLRDIHIKDLNLTVHMNPYSLRPLVVHATKSKPRANTAPFSTARNYSFDAPLAIVRDTGCEAVDPAIARGKIAVIEAATCSPKRQARSLQAAGAVGMVLTGTDPEVSAPPTLDDDRSVIGAITIPVIAIGRRDGDALRSAPGALAGTATATLRDTIGYVTAARLEHVDVDADPSKFNAPDHESSYLYMDGVDPLVSKLYVHLAVTAKTGSLRLWDEGLRDTFRLPYPALPTQDTGESYPPKGRSAEYEIALADVELHRLAQLPTEWARRDNVANTLEIDLETRTLPCDASGAPGSPELHPDGRGAKLHITGELYNYWDRPYDGSWNLRLDGHDMGPTIQTCIKHKISGDHLDGTITLTGPFVALPKISLAMKDLDFSLPLRANEDPLQLTLAEVQGSIDLVNEQGSLDKTTALIRNGREPGEVEVSANFGLKPYNARAHVEIVKPIDVGRFLPRAMEPVGRFLKGRLTAVGDADIGFSLEDFDLSLGRSEKDTAVRVHKGRLFTDDDFDTVKIQQVQFDAGRNHAQVNGEVDLANNVIKKIVIDHDFPDLGLWLKRFGLPPIVQSAGGGQIVITGPISKPTINVATDLGGVPCLDKVRIVDSRYDSATHVLEVRRLTSAGLGGELVGTARIRKEPGRRAVIEKLHVDGKRLDASRICKIGKPLRGVVNTLDVDLSGTIDPNRSALDWLDLAQVKARADHISIAGDKFHSVALCINRSDDKTCRPRTGYLDRDDLHQCAQAKRSGFCAVATATRDGGGMVDATIARLPATRTRTRTTPAKLGGTIALSDVSLSLLKQLIGSALADSGSAPKVAKGKAAKGKPAKGKAAPPKPAAPKSIPGASIQTGGLASMTLHLEGNPDAPQAAGAIQLLRSWVGESFVGDAQLVVTPSKLGTVPGIRFEGAALAGRVRVTGTLGTRAPYPIEVQISGRRLDARLFIDLQKRLGLPMPVEAWATGTITVRDQLRPKTKVEPEAWIELSELQATVTHTGTDGRLVPLTFTAVDQDRARRPAVSIHVTPSSIDFACRDAEGKRFECTTKLAVGPQNAAPAGVIDFRGHVTPQQVAIEAVGKIDLATLTPLFENQFTCVSGSADVSASISGSYDHPSYEAALALDHIEATPVGGDTILEAESGLVKIANGALGFTDVRVRVRDPHRDSARSQVGPQKTVRANSCAGKQRGTVNDEAGELFVKGNIELDGLTPKSWGVLVEGKLAGKMLVVIAKDYVSQATGLASIEGDVLLTGTGPTPQVSGTLTFDPPPPCKNEPSTADTVGGREDCRKPGELPRPITIIPRYLPREIAIAGGTVEIDTESDANDNRTYSLTVRKELRLSIDGEGSVRVVDGGYVELRDGTIAKLGLRIDADDLSFRQPGKLNLIVSARRVALSRADESSPLQASGRIQIIDGTYEQDFEIAEGIRSLGSNAPPTTPVWDASSLLGSAELDLSIDVRKFSLKSNIAQVDMSGENISLSGSPREPRLSGSIRVDRGRFKLPGMRAAFTRTNGQINFSRDQRASNPDLKITSEADYRDLTGQDHVITLTIEGAIDSLKWDLHTSTGYNKSQTVALLLLGRNPEQLRRSLGDQILGSNINNIDPTTNPSQGFADQIVKDLAGDWVSDLLENSLTKITRLDVFRIEVGFGSIGLHVEKKVAENVNVIGTYEQTIRGQTINARGEIKTPFRFSLQGGWLKKDFNDPAEQDITDASIKAVFHLLP